MRRLVLSALVLSAVALVAVFGPPVPRGAAHTDQSFTYEIHARGDVHTDMGAFANHVDATLADERGWTLGSAVAFHRVADGGDFNVVLATPEAIEDASPVCSRHWSCRVGDDVLINEYRWNHGTDAYHRPLDSYRHYVVNHEVGHWLGLDHDDCPGSDEAAPVMMQQSKGLDGCTSTVWPLEWEQEAAADRHGSHTHDDIAYADLLWYEPWNDAGVTVGRSTGHSFRWDSQWVEGWGAPDWAAAADVDGDGFGDLVWYEEWNDHGVTVGTSDGETQFAYAGQWATGLESPYFADLGDVNDDGAADLVWYTTSGGGTVDVRLSTASTFTSPERGASGWGAPDWAAVADVNGDGFADLVWYEEWNRGGVTVGLANGDGSFRWAGQWITGLPEPAFADVGDVDADGDHDLVWYATSGGGTVDVYVSAGDGFVDDGTWVAGWGAPDWAAVGDVNLDGRADLAWYEGWNHGGVTVGLSDGGRFEWAGQWIRGWGPPAAAFLRHAG